MMLSIVIAYLLIGNIVASEGSLQTDDDYLDSGFFSRSITATVVALCWPLYVMLGIILWFIFVFMQAENRGKQSEFSTRNSYSKRNQRRHVGNSGREQGAGPTRPKSMGGSG